MLRSASVCLIIDLYQIHPVAHELGKGASMLHRESTEASLLPLLHIAPA